MRTTPQYLVEDYTSKGWWGTDTLNSLFCEAVADAADRPALADPPNREALVGGSALRYTSVSFTHLALPTIYSV